jgi:hypothetical protein
VNIRFSSCCLLFTLGIASAGAAAQVVVVGAKSAIGAMSKEEVVAAFMGKIPGLEPLDQAEGSSIREEFYARGIGKSASQMKAYWAKQSFTGKGALPREYPGSAEVKRALSGNLLAIGYIEKAAVDPSVKVVFEGR